MSELLLLRIAIGLYLTTAALACWRRTGDRLIVGGLTVALAVHTVAIGMRWLRLDHGPYVNLFEILSSNVWSLHAAVLLAVLFLPWLRPVMATALPLLQVLTLWLLATAPIDGLVPVTYDTPWLAVHVWLGKIFMGLVVVACGVALTILWRRRIPSSFATLPGNASLEELIYRIVLLAFLFETAMLIAGALWAQDAWGRYWAWDPLETWAFLTWLLVAAYLHLRPLKRPSPAASSAMVLGIFAVAFLTFFGVPFVSLAPHKGAV